MYGTAQVSVSAIQFPNFAECDETELQAYDANISRVSDYCGWLRNARRERKLGQIEKALYSEGKAQAIREKLPENWTW